MSIIKKTFESIHNVVLSYCPVLGTIKVERLHNKPGNEMWRIGGGFHGYRRYLRLDWGSKGWRWTRDFDWYKDYFKNIHPHCSDDHQRDLDRYMGQLIQEGIDNPSKYEFIVVTRGQQLVRERADLFPKLWAKGREFHRCVYIK